MARLIDAEQLKQQKTVLWDPALGFCDCVLVEDIDNTPALEVVRCKDCKHWCEDTLSCMCGNHYDDNWYAEDFCSYGERKDNG